MDLTERSPRILRFVTSLLLVAGIAAVLWPVWLGGRSAVIMVSGVSMEPTMRTGDLALLRQEPAYEVGDIVAFRVPEGQQGAGAVVIHRIIGGSGQTGYRLQGDNKPLPDPWTPKNADVIGSRWSLVPRAGAVVARAIAPVPLGAVAAATVVFLILARPARKATADDALTERA